MVLVGTQLTKRKSCLAESYTRAAVKYSVVNFGVNVQMCDNKNADLELVQWKTS